MRSLMTTLQQNATLQPEGVALVGPNLTLNTLELFESAKAALSWLLNSGVKSGDLVAMRLTSETECVILAALDGIGATASIIRFQEQINNLSKWGFTHLVVNEAVDAPRDVKVLKLLPSSLAPGPKTQTQSFHKWLDDEPYRVLTTSGTTGHSKAVALTMRQFEYRVKRARDGWHQVEPYFGLLGLDATVSQVALTRSIRDSRPFFITGTPEHCAQIVSNWGIRSVTGTQAQLEQLFEAQKSRQFSLTRVVVPGSYPTAGFQSTIRRRMPELEIFVGFGSTESGQVFFGEANPEVQAFETTMPELELTVVDPEQPLRTDLTQGLLGIRGPGVASAYLGEQDSLAFSPRKGWFFPGDFVSIKPDGVVTLLGRANDVINFKGLKLNPSKVEELLERLIPGSEFLVSHVADKLEINYVAAAQIDEESVAALIGKEFGIPGPFVLNKRVSIPTNHSGKKVRHR